MHEKLLEAFDQIFDQAELALGRFLKQKIKALIYEHNDIAQQLEMELIGHPSETIPWFHSNCEEPYYEKDGWMY